MSDSFSTTIDWFAKNIESRRRLLPSYAHAANHMTTEISKNLEKFIEEHGYDKEYEEDGSLARFAVPQDYSRRWGLLKRSYQHSLIFADLTWSSKL